MPRFWDSGERPALPKIIRPPEIAAVKAITCKKREHKCQYLDEEERGVRLR